MEIEKFTFNPVYENTYVIWDEDGVCAIIDPGCMDAAEEYELKSFIEGKQLTVDKLINTHCHFDHVYGNKFVADHWGLPLHMHKAEEPILEMAARSCEMYGLPVPGASPEDRVFLTPGETLQVGKIELDILFVPGHAPGHVAFYHAPSKNVIAGDVLFHGSIGRTDLPLADFDTLVKSIKEVMYQLPDDTKVWCGHGPETTIGTEKVSNAYVRA